MSTSQLPAQIDETARRLAVNAAEAVTLAKGFRIMERSGFGIAAERLRSIKIVQKQLEEKRTGVTGPLNSVLRTINDWFKEPATALADAEAIYKREMASFEAEEQRRVREEETRVAEKARIEREELLRRSAKAEESGKVEKAVELQQRAQEVVQEKPAYAPAQAKGLSFGEKWEFTVLDADKVPRGFLMVDSLKIGQLVRAMKADAQKVLGDGVRVYSTPMVRASSR